MDINNAGQVLGFSVKVLNVGGGNIPLQRATLWAGGVATDLHDFLDPIDRAAAWEFFDSGIGSVFMNDAGVIAVNAYNRLERSYGVFLLTPQSNGNVPEPSSLLLTLGALAAMAGCTRRKQRVILIEPSVKTSVVLA